MRLAVLLLVLALATGCTDDRQASPSPPPSSSPSSAPSHTAEQRAAGPRASTATALAQNERTLARSGLSDHALTESARRQQVAYRTWSDHPGWDHFVLSRLPRQLRPIARDNVEARRALRSIYPSTSSELPTELPAWRIEPPAPLTELVADYRLAQRRTGVDWQYLAAINFVETDFGRITGTSDAGAQGPMQFMPATWAAYGNGGDIHEPHDAILGAGRLLAANGFAADPEAALHHYNNSDGYVRAVTLLAGIIREHPHELAAYHQWQVYFLTARGPILLPEGYHRSRPVPVDRWLRQHPKAG